MTTTYSTDPAALSYTYLAHGTQRTGHVRATEAEAIAAAEDHLGAVRCDDEWVYRAEETGEYYALTCGDMIDAGAAILAGADDWYSIWCASSGSPATEEQTEAAEAANG